MRAEEPRESLVYDNRLRFCRRFILAEIAACEETDSDTKTEQRDEGREKAWGLANKPQGVANVLKERSEHNFNST